MTESREPGDRDAKRRKTRDAPEEKQQEKVGDKPKEVSEKGTPMDSTPSPADENPESELREVEVKTESGDDDISAEKTVIQQEEEDLQRAIELSKESLMLASMGLNPNASGSTSSDLSPSDMAEFKSESSGSSINEVVESNSEEMPEDPEGRLLFEIQVHRSNWLVIRAEATKFFPTLPAYCESNIEKELKIIDSNKEEWTLTLVNYIEENVYLISKRWYEFRARHKLYPTDTIIFYPRLKYYDVNFGRLGGDEVSIPEYARGDLLFELELQLAEIEDDRLSLPTADVETHFPAVKMVPGTSHTKQIVRFTDVHSKDWYMEITLHNGTAYMITYGWPHFVREHKLEAMDRIMFYMPAQQLHAKHFLIEYVRKKDGGSNLNSPPLGGSERSEHENGHTKSSGEGEAEGS